MARRHDGYEHCASMSFANEPCARYLLSLGIDPRQNRFGEKGSRLVSIDFVHRLEPVPTSKYVSELQVSDESRLYREVARWYPDGYGHQNEMLTQDEYSGLKARTRISGKKHELN